MDYASHIASPAWEAKRQLKLAEADWRCERCGHHARRVPGGKPAGLHVHHLTYRHLGAERLDELEVLCAACHQIEHGQAADTEQTRERIRERLSRSISNRTVDGFDSDNTDDITNEVEAWDRLADQAGF